MNIKRLTMAAIVALATALVGIAAPASAADGPPWLSGQRIHSSIAHGPCINLQGDPGHYVTPGTRLALTAVGTHPSCGDAQNVIWYLNKATSPYYQLKDANSGLCAGVAGNSTANGAAIVAWSCQQVTNQRWRLSYVRTENGVPFYKIVNWNSNKCIGFGGSGAAGTTLVQWDCQNAGNQIWYFTQNIYG
ncbi:hypothetical protein GCM10009804_64310 [Kribbella hippodromi]|uniref:Ricin B lectin domain-containing protein n=1 Tax=Kribbella hippodromi TaxID=434347 RepID=A0ABN2EBM1_9ACTN